MPVDRRTPVFYALLASHFGFIALLACDILLDLRTDYTLGMPVSYTLALGYIVLGGVAPALLAAFYIEHLLDAGDPGRKRRVLLEHTIGLTVLFTSTSTITYFWYMNEPLEFMPLGALLLYVLLSGILWFAHVTMLVRNLLTGKTVEASTNRTRGVA